MDEQSYSTKENSTFNNSNDVPQNENNDFAIASLVLSILSVLSFLIFLSGDISWIYFCVIFGIMGIILGACSKHKTGPYVNRRPTIGLAGLILSIIMLTVNVLLISFYILLITSSSNIFYNGIP